MEGSVGVKGLLRSSFFYYTAGILNNLLGFAYWLVLSRIAGPGLIGYVSSSVALAMIMVGLLSLGAGVGIERRVAGLLGEGRRDEASRVFWSAALVWGGIYAAAGGLLAAAAPAASPALGLTGEQVVVAGVLLALGSSTLFSSLLMALLRTDVLMLAGVVGNLARLVGGVALVLLGLGWVGAAAGYILLNLVVTAAGLLEAWRRLGFNPHIDPRLALGVAVVGLASWIPATLMLAGRWLGVIFVFGSSSAAGAGRYYIAFTLAGFITGAGASIATMLLPALSMDKGLRGRAGRLVEASASLLAPVAIASAAAAPWLLGVLGPSYTSAAPALVVLLASWIPVIYNTGFSSLLYSEDSYREALGLGLARNIPRIILYILLTPVLGDLGAAVAYTAGSYSGLAYSLGRSADSRMGFSWRRPLKASLLALLLIAPMLLAPLQPAPVIAGAAASYLAYCRLGVLRRSEVSVLASPLLRRGRRVRAVYERLKPVLDIVLPE